MPKLNPESLEKWLSAGNKLVGSPIAGLVLDAIGSKLTATITPEQLAGMKARLADAGVRKARAKQRAGS